MPLQPVLYYLTSQEITIQGQIFFGHTLTLYVQHSLALRVFERVTVVNGRLKASISPFWLRGLRLSSPRGPLSTQKATRGPVGFQAPRHDDTAGGYKQILEHHSPVGVTAVIYCVGGSSDKYTAYGNAEGVVETEQRGQPAENKSLDGDGKEAREAKRQRQEE